MPALKPARGARGFDDAGSAPTPGEDGALRARRRGRRVVALTGAHTFLGQSLLGLLEEDPSVGRVVVLDVRGPESAGAKMVFYEVDLMQSGADSRLAEILRVEGVHALAHLAFVRNPTQATAWAHELESVGTMHLLDACRQHVPASLVVGSTTLVYGAHPSNPNFLSETHSLRGLSDSDYVADKIDVERQVDRFASDRTDCCVTIARFAPILGPTIDNYIARWLSRRVVPTVMGHDPLVQFCHEVDAVAALKLAIDGPVPGVFNIASHGVLPISTVVKLVGRLSVPIPYPLFRRVAALLWVAQLNEAPPSFVAALRYLCVADGSRARRELRFVPAYSSRDAVLDFEGALRLREARLLQRAIS